MERQRELWLAEEAARIPTLKRKLIILTLVLLTVITDVLHAKGYIQLSSLMNDLGLILSINLVFPKFSLWLNSP